MGKTFAIAMTGFGLVLILSAFVIWASLNHHESVQYANELLATKTAENHEIRSLLEEGASSGKSDTLATDREVPSISGLDPALRQIVRMGSKVLNSDGIYVVEESELFNPAATNTPEGSATPTPGLGVGAR